MKKSKMDPEEYKRQKQIKLPKTATFASQKYDLILDDPDGITTDKRDRNIIIRRDLSKRVGLETAIHEALHALKWAVHEETVNRDARDLARFLWNLGYRQVH